MHIDRIQNYNTSFNANLRIINKEFSKSFLNDLNEKANLIGLPRDVIELNYTNFKDIKEDAIMKNQICPPSKHHEKRLSDVLEARFIPHGDEYGVDHFQLKLSANTYLELWEQEELAAKKYLHNLAKKYPF